MQEGWVLARKATGKQSPARSIVPSLVSLTRHPWVGTVFVVTELATNGEWVLLTKSINALKGQLPLPDRLHPSINSHMMLLTFRSFQFCGSSLLGMAPLDSNSILVSQGVRPLPTLSFRASKSAETEFKFTRLSVSSFFTQQTC